MKFMSAVHSDVGIKKKTNQDSLCLKVANTPSGEVAMAIVCDGMGGLKKGELASATVIRVFSDWFESALPAIIKSGYTNKAVIDQWMDMIKAQNEMIGEYGENNHLQLGTTLVGMLIVGNDLVIVNVGDSRIYKITDKIQLLTEDQTVVQREVKLGMLTPEQAETDPRGNVLLQCIGASSVVTPEFIEGKVNSGELFMLCSDGFRHRIKQDEMIGILASSLMVNESVMKKSLIDLIELNKERKETDNITAMLLKAM